MSDWPLVWLLFPTHKRTRTSLATIDSLREHLIYPNLHWHIASDGSGETDDGTGRRHIEVLIEYVKRFYPDVTGHEIDTPPGAFNTGGNINTAIRLMREKGGSIYHLNFDDWALFRDLDIRPMVDVLDSNDRVGFIRLSYHVPGHGMLSERYDAPRLNDGYMWLRIIRDWSLRNRWVQDSYLISTQPYVAHVRFHDAYGMHPENCSPGEAEVGLGRLYNESSLGEDGPQVLFPIGPITVHAPWSHSADRANDYKRIFG